MSAHKLQELMFQQLDRLNNDDLSGEALQDEINRAQAINQVAGRIIEMGALQIQALKVKAEYGNGKRLPFFDEDIRLIK